MPANPAPAITTRGRDMCARGRGRFVLEASVGSFAVRRSSIPMAEAPTVVDAIGFLTQALFLFTTLLTLVEYLRKRNRQLAEVALMFGSLGVSSVVTWIGELGYKPAWLATLSSVALVAHPFLIVRVVKQFRDVPPLVEWPLAVGMVLSWAVLTSRSLFDGGAPMPPGATVPIVLYFVAGEGY